MVNFVEMMEQSMKEILLIIISQGKEFINGRMESIIKAVGLIIVLMERVSLHGMMEGNILVSLKII